MQYLDVHQMAMVRTMAIIMNQPGRVHAGPARIPVTGDEAVSY
jgi:hypothetical protein